MNRDDRAVATSAVALLFALGVTLQPALAAAAASAAPHVEQARAESPVGIYLSTGHGDSMQPTMAPGDRALCLAGIEADVGHVVAIERDHHPDIRHRVVEANTTHVVTKGDGNDYRDDPARRDRVKCTVVYSETAGLWP